MTNETSATNTAQKNCLNDFLQFGNVMSILSFILSLTASIVLFLKQKNRHFPHCMPLLLCISSTMHFLGESLNVLYTDEYLISNTSLCWFITFLSHFGLILVFWIWIASFIVLYRATVLKVYIFRMRENKLRYIIPLTLWIVFVMSLPLSIGSYEFSEEHSRCVLVMKAKWLIILFTFGWIATSLVMIFAPAIIKALLTRENLILARWRVLMLRQEAIRQVVLGFTMFLTAAVSGYRYGIVILVAEIATNESNTTWFQNMMFSSCAADIIWDRQFGVWIALIFLLSIENYKSFKSLFSKRSHSNSRLSEENYNDQHHHQHHRFACEEVMEQQFNVIKSPRSCASGMPGAVTAHSVPPVFNNETSEVYMSYLLSRVRRKLEIDGMILSEDDTKNIVDEVASTFTNVEVSTSDSGDGGILPEDFDARVENAQRNWIRDNIDNHSEDDDNISSDKNNSSQKS